jgi:hypothetical protein
MQDELKTQGGLQTGTVHDELTFKGKSAEIFGLMMDQRGSDGCGNAAKDAWQWVSHHAQGWWLAAVVE